MDEYNLYQQFLWAPTSLEFEIIIFLGFTILFHTFFFFQGEKKKNKAEYDIDDRNLNCAFTYLNPDHQWQLNYSTDFKSALKDESV